VSQKKGNNSIRTHFFIDRKFQGRYMLTMLIPMVILLCFMLITLYIATQTMLSTTVRIIKNDIESKVSMELQDQTSPSIETYKSLVGTITDYFREFSMNDDFKKSLVHSMLWVFGAGIMLVIIQIVLLTIFFSHKVAGPVFRFEKACHSMIQGVYTNKINLRKGDEMQNLSLLLNEVCEVTNKRFSELKKATTKEEQEKILNSLQL
jgi:nitrate/nitrite-specific signal transduction histidine kinase